MEGKERRDAVFSHRSRTSDARLSMAACKHRITRRRSPAELIGRPSNRLMKNSCGQAKQNVRTLRIPSDTKQVLRDAKISGHMRA
jgi:hypothetical protein